MTPATLSAQVSPRARVSDSPHAEPSGRGFYELWIGGALLAGTWREKALCRTGRTRDVVDAGAEACTHSSQWVKRRMSLV